MIGLSIELELKRLEGGDIETIGIKWATGIAHQNKNKKLSRTDPFIKKKNKEIEDLDDVVIFLFFFRFWGFVGKSRNNNRSNDMNGQTRWSERGWESKQSDVLTPGGSLTIHTLVVFIGIITERTNESLKI